MAEKEYTVKFTAEELEVAKDLEERHIRLREAAENLLKAWDGFNDPKIRVGPVYPTMETLRAVLKSAHEPHTGSRNDR